MPLGALTLLLALGASFFCFRQPHVATPAAPARRAEAGWYSLYFTEPTDPASETLRGGPDQALADAIDEARYSVDVAIFDLDLWSVRDALLRAARRGVAVRLVTDTENMQEPEIAALVEAGIPVVGDRRDPLMHHKFVILDRLDVWTGSMNFTVSSAYRDNNNLIRLRSTEVAEDFAGEFEEMFTEDRFGALSRADTPHPLVAIGGHQVEVLFSPDDGVAVRILELVQSAQTSIDMLAYSFTSDAIGNALLERAGAGVRVRVVVDEGQMAATGSEYARLRQAGIDIRLDGNEGSMHHKVIILDGAIVLTGSYNFTRSAEEYNDEAVLILHDPELARQYLEEFERLYVLAGQPRLP